MIFLKIQWDNKEQTAQFKKKNLGLAPSLKASKMSNNVLMSISMHQQQQKSSDIHEYYFLKKYSIPRVVGAFCKMQLIQESVIFFLFFYLTDKNTNKRFAMFSLSTVA